MEIIFKLFRGVLVTEKGPPRVHFEPQVGPKLFQDSPSTPPGGWKNDVVEKVVVYKKQKTRYQVRAKLGLPSDPSGPTGRVQDSPKEAKRAMRAP